MIRIDRKSKTPAYRQLYLGLRSDIETGELAPGTKLPPLRKLAADLGIARNTVETAYRQLVVEGYLSSRRGSGYVVEDLDFSVLAAHTPPALVLAPEDFDAGPHDLGKSPIGDDFSCAYDFSYGNRGFSDFPVASWKALGAEALSFRTTPGANVYSDPFGLPLLRVQIAKRLGAVRGVECSPEQVVLQPGTQASLNSIITLFERSSRTVAMEEPGYDVARAVFESRGCAIANVPTSTDDADFLSALETSGADLAYMTPSIQFPLGKVMPLSTRLKVIDWAVRNDSYVIEDDYCCEFHYNSQPISSMASLDTRGRVIYLGTYSKILSPALRIAFIVLPPQLVERWHALFPGYTCEVPWLTQEILRRFMASGRFSRYARQSTKKYRESHDALMRSLERELGDRVDVVGGDAGLHLLVGDREGRSQEELVALARANDVAVYGTDQYWSAPVHGLASYVLVGYSSIAEADIPKGIRLLRQAWYPKGR